MNKRNLLIVAAWILCFGTVWAVLQQRTELARLRSEPQQSTEQAPLQGNATVLAETAEQSSPSGNLITEDTSRELLRLRGEVTRLTDRKRELAGVAETAERLRGQLAAGAEPGGTQLPPGYLRKANAQLLGYSSPENTVQSWLWALQHRDVTNYLRALSPDEAQTARARKEYIGGDFFKGMDPLFPGLAIQNHQDLPDGSVDLQVYVGPALPSEKIHLELIDGEWKIANW